MVPEEWGVEWLGVVGCGEWDVCGGWRSVKWSVHVRMDGGRIGIYTIYIHIFIYLFMLSTNRGTPRPVDKKQHLTLKVLVVMIEKNNNRKSNSSNNRKE